MLMPGVFSRLRWRQFGVDLTLEYGKALTASHTHHRSHRAAYFPLVHPMNASELTLGALGELRWSSGFGLRARIQRATPIADAHGTARAIVTPSAKRPSKEHHLPLVSWEGSRSASRPPGYSS
jgi:hypothetical protein